MVKVQNVPYIHCRDVCELIGVHWSDCEFAQMAENDSYHSIFCDNDSLKMLQEELEDGDDEETIKRKEFNRKLVAKKPYFFIYNYSTIYSLE